MKEKRQWQPTKWPTIRKTWPWQRKAFQPTGGGERSYIDAGVLFLVSFFNIFEILTSGKDATLIWGYTLLFLVIAFLLLITKSKWLTSIVYLAIGFFISFDPINKSDFSGVIFFIYSFHLIKKNWYAVFLLMMSLVSLSSRLILFDETIPQTLIMIVVFAYIYAVYYFLIYKNTESPIRSKITTLSTQENELLEDIAAGLSQKEAIANRGYTSSHGYDLVRNIKRKMDCDSIPAIIYKLGEYSSSKSRFKK